jgi:hypothetical protein
MQRLPNRAVYAVGVARIARVVNARSAWSVNARSARSVNARSARAVNAQSARMSARKARDGTYVKRSAMVKRNR